MTGLRNPYRASFDRATGDMYIGDVGESSREEVDFLKAGTNASGPPADFGWPAHEGTANGLSAYSPFPATNTFTGVTSLNPIRQYAHAGAGGNAVIGGIRYHGPIASLQGKYFFADFVQTNDATVGNQISMLDFDPNTNPAAFNGANGTLTDVSGLWNSLIVDPTDPTYTSAIGNRFGLDHISAFGEDNAGNLYIVDFGNLTPGQSTFDGEYPGAGLGEIFRVTAIPEPACTMLLGSIAAIAGLSRFSRSRRGRPHSISARAAQ